MGLMDILNGMQNGPRGQREPGSGGMSPVTMAILGLLAYKAIKSFSGGQPATANQPAPSAPPQAGGGLGNLLNAGLGGLLGAGAGSILGGKAGGSVGDIFSGNSGGSVLSSGLGELLKQLQQNGQGEAANSWVGTGPNKTIPANDLASAIGADDIDSAAVNPTVPTSSRRGSRAMPWPSTRAVSANRLPQTVPNRIECSNGPWTRHKPMRGDIKVLSTVGKTVPNATSSGL